MSEAAIIQAAKEAGNKVHRSEGDFWTDGPINLSKFVRFLARQPHVVSEPTLDVTPVYATNLEAKMDAEIRQLRRKLAASPRRPADLDYIEELKARIEVLESALRRIAECADSGDTSQEVADIIHAALAGSQDK